MAGNSSAKNKRQEEKYVQMIRELASLPMNKQCFDCNSKGPTYVEYVFKRQFSFLKIQNLLFILVLQLVVSFVQHVVVFCK